MAPSTRPAAHLIAAALLAFAPTLSLANPNPQGNGGYTVINADGSTQVILPTTTIAGPGLTPPLISIPTGVPAPSTGGTIDEGTMIVTLPVESYGTPFDPVPPSPSSGSLGSVPPVPLPSPLPTTESGSGLPGLTSSGGGVSPTPSGSTSQPVSGSVSGSGATPTPTAAPAGAPAMAHGVVGAGFIAGAVGLLML